MRILAVEQMQALPCATQLLARLGAEVVKVEHPGAGESGRGSLPAMLDPEGRRVGATFLRNNLGKRSVGIDLKTPEGRELFLRWPRASTSCAENFKAGHDGPAGPRLRRRRRACTRGDLPVGVGLRQHRRARPTATWPAYAAIAEAMSGIYEFKREPGRPPRGHPVGALGDIGSALFGVIGVLAALRHRDRTGEGQHVDVAMLDAMVAMTDIVTNFWSMGIRGPVEDQSRPSSTRFRRGDG